MSERCIADDVGSQALKSVASERPATVNTRVPSMRWAECQWGPSVHHPRPSYRLLVGREPEGYPEGAAPGGNRYDGRAAVRRPAQRRWIGLNAGAVLRCLRRRCGSTCVRLLGTTQTSLRRGRAEFCSTSCSAAESGPAWEKKRCPLFRVSAPPPATCTLNKMQTPPCGPAQGAVFVQHAHT